MSDLGPQIQNRRRSLGMRVEDVAKRTGLSVGSIRAIEQGRRKPSRESLTNLEDALGTSFVVDQVLAPFQGGRPRSEDRSPRLVLIQRVLDLDEEGVDRVLRILDAI